MRRKQKVTKALLMSLAVISILGFLAIMSNVWFKFNFISDNLESFLLIIIGFGLVVEGQVRKWSKFPQGGISSNELAHIITGIVGIFSLVIGFLDLLGVTGSTILNAKGIISSIAIVMIIIETWWVK